MDWSVRSAETSLSIEEIDLMELSRRSIHSIVLETSYLVDSKHSSRGMLRSKLCFRDLLFSPSDVLNLLLLERICSFVLGDFLSFLDPVFLDGSPILKALGVVSPN